MAFRLITLTRSNVLKKRTSCQGLNGQKVSAPFALSHQTFRSSPEVRRLDQDVVPRSVQQLDRIEIIGLGCFAVTCRMNGCELR